MHGVRTFVIALNLLRIVGSGRLLAVAVAVASRAVVAQARRIANHLGSIQGATSRASIFCVVVWNAFVELLLFIEYKYLAWWELLGGLVIKIWSLDCCYSMDRLLYVYKPPAHCISLGLGNTDFCGLHGITHQKSSLLCTCRRSLL